MRHIRPSKINFRHWQTEEILSLWRHSFTTVVEMKCTIVALNLSIIAITIKTINTNNNKKEFSTESFQNTKELR